MTQSELLEEIARLVLSNNNTSLCAIFGAPAAGKTAFLKNLRTYFEGYGHCVMVYGPIPMSHFRDEVQFRHAIIEWLETEEVLTARCPTDEYLVAASPSLFWDVARRYIDRGQIRTLIIEIDEANADAMNHDALYDLFADIRKFCHEWKAPDFNLHFICAGTWLPAFLDPVFRRNQTSWPFEANLNLFYLPDLTIAEVSKWLVAECPTISVSSIHGEYLWELTNGDGRTVKAVLEHLAQTPMSCEALYAASERVITSSAFVEVIREQIARLTPSAQEILGKFLEGHFVQQDRQIRVIEELVVAGLARTDEVGGKQLIRLKNWVIESTLRHHADKLSSWLPANVFKDYRELVPPVSCLNRDAHRFICEIENLLRNLVILRLGKLKPGNMHPLKGEYTDQRRLREGEDLVDEYTRAIEWRKQVEKTPYVDTHAALISFSQTKHLLSLVSQLIYGKKDPLFVKLEPLWKDIEGFKVIRDAVEHNQIITEASYDTLLRIRSRLYDVLQMN